MVKTTLAFLRRIGAFIGRINTFLLLVFSFYVILFPMAMIRRLLTPGKREARWEKREHLQSNHFEKQY
jgi:hypothetical protein